MEDHQEPLLLTVTELAKKHGQIKPFNASLGATPFTSKHRVAAVRHGWNGHANKTNKQPRMTDEDYLQALDEAHAGKVHEPANKRQAKQAPIAVKKNKQKKGGVK